MFNVFGWCNKPSTIRKFPSDLSHFTSKLQYVAANKIVLLPQKTNIFVPMALKKFVSTANYLFTSPQKNNRFTFTIQFPLLQLKLY